MSPQAELDQAYDQLVWAPHRDAIQAEIRKDCEAVRKAMPPRTERYGKADVEQIDIFAPPGASGVPVFTWGDPAIDAAAYVARQTGGVIIDITPK